MVCAGLARNDGGKLTGITDPESIVRGNHIYVWVCRSRHSMEETATLRAGGDMEPTVKD